MERRKTIAIKSGLLDKKPLMLRSGLGSMKEVFLSGKSRGEVSEDGNQEYRIGRGQPNQANGNTTKRADACEPKSNNTARTGTNGGNPGRSRPSWRTENRHRSSEGQPWLRNNGQLASLPGRKSCGTTRNIQLSGAGYRPRRRMTFMADEKDDAESTEDDEPPSPQSEQSEAWPLNPKSGHQSTP